MAGISRRRTWAAQGRGLRHAASNRRQHDRRGPRQESARRIRGAAPHSYQTGGPVKRLWLPLGAALALSTAEPGRADTPPGGPRLLHVPAGARTAEQGILTPVPISLEVPADLPARRVLLH